MAKILFDTDIIRFMSDYTLQVESNGGWATHPNLWGVRDGLVVELVGSGRALTFQKEFQEMYQQYIGRLVVE